MPDYSKAKIYKLVCNISGKQYIGSTCYTLSQRKAKHVYDSKLKDCYVRSRDIIEGGNFDIILIEDFPCNNIEQLKARERYWIENTENVNFAIPNSTRQEIYKRWYSKETNKLKVKQYVDEHREHINQQRQKKYHESEEIKARQSAWQSQIVKCECGTDITRGCLLKHMKRKAHLDKMKEQEKKTT